jgi:hypothetical protein
MAKWPYSDVVHGNSDRSDGGGRTSIDNDKATGKYGSDAFAFIEQGNLVRQPASKRSYDNLPKSNVDAGNPNSQGSSGV